MVVASFRYLFILSRQFHKLIAFLFIFAKDFYLKRNQEAARRLFTMHFKNMTFKEEWQKERNY